MVEDPGTKNIDRFFGNLNLNHLFLLSALETGIPAMAWGMVGSGKTDIATDFATQLGYHVVLEHPSHHTDSQSFGGYHFVDHKNRPEGSVPLTRRTVPGWMEEAVQATEEGKKVAIILDEANLANEDVFKEMLRFLRGKKIGPLSLPPETPIIMLCNPPNMALYPTPLEVPIQTRVMMHQWVVDNKSTIDFFKSGGKVQYDIPPISPDWRKSIDDSMYLTGMYLESKPDAIAKIPEDATQRNEMDSYPVPRTWEYMAILRSWAVSRHLPNKALEKLARGVVGRGEAKSFTEFAAKNDLANPEVALNNPLDFTLPDRGDRVISLVTGIAEAFGRDPTEARWRNAWSAIGRVFKTEYRDAAIAGARLMREKNIGDWPEPAQLRGLLGDPPSNSSNNNLGSVLGSIKPKQH